MVYSKIKHINHTCNILRWSIHNAYLVHECDSVLSTE